MAATTAVIGSPCDHGSVPDWTYHPLRRPMAALLGERRSRRAALRLVAALTGLPGGRGLVAGLGHTAPPPEAAASIAGAACVARVGATVGPEVAPAAVTALPALGAGLLEIGPFSIAAVDQARRILAGARAPVALRVAGDDALEVAATAGSLAAMVVLDMAGGPSERALLARLSERVGVPVLGGIEAGRVEDLAPGVDVVLREASPDRVRAARAGGRIVIATTSAASPGSAADLIAAGAAAVLITAAGLVEAGPGWFHRATLSYLARRPAGRPGRPVSRLAWVAGLGLGLGMIGGGVGAAIVALGPVLLPYDVSFLGVGSTGLAAINPRLIHFLQHDRITLSGTMVALGVLYVSLSWWGIRQGRAWARNALLASGLVGFPTLFYFFAYRYVEPVHVALAAVLFPLFVLATWRVPSGGAAPGVDEGPPDERQRALLGQLLMVTAAVGLVAGGLTISLVGMTAVFVPADLAYMNTSAPALAAANHVLTSFIAHDRAGFGGALISAGVAVLLMSAWGWERGQAWVWWALAASATVGFGAALAIHVGVAYTDFGHVVPIYAGILVTATGLALGRPYLLATRSPARASGLTVSPVTRR
jgi:hypothetical protein